MGKKSRLKRKTKVADISFDTAKTYSTFKGTVVVELTRGAYIVSRTAGNARAAMNKAQRALNEKIYGNN